jgi:murein L,D-transpeptidase YafK
MNIYQKIDEMFEDKNLALEILNELKDIKAILKDGRKTYNYSYKKTLPKDYFEFVNKFRNEMREDINRGFTPEFVYEDMLLAINSKGLIYNKMTKRILPKHKAFEIYEKFYEKAISN